ncbi:MAG: hypothetical protein JNG84_14920 [Archangium sp.]|nr:hypothetical protein [Archangium sp.]
MRIVFLAVVVLAACGAPNGVDLRVADSPEPLTSLGNNSLFTLRLFTAPASYALLDLQVEAKLGATTTPLNLTLTDTNANGALDVDEEVVVREPTINFFDGTTVGQAVTVQLSVKPMGAVSSTLATAVWTPSN